MIYDVIIIGAGAAGLMCAGIAGQRGRSVLILDHNEKPGEKIRISGGGRCNFTNLHCEPKNFLSQNSHFCKSALAQYGPQDFIALIERYGIGYHEKHQTGMQLGQLFCDGKSQQIIDMLLSECKAGNTKIKLGVSVLSITKSDDVFNVAAEAQNYQGRSVVMACGGPSIPKMGGSSFGYKIAKDFGLNIIEPRPALVPLTLTDKEFEPLKALAGVACPARVSHKKTSFDEAILLTHRGLSGPAILQISSYAAPGEPITINLAPNEDFTALISQARQNHGVQSPKGFLEGYIPARLAAYLADTLKAKRMGDISKAEAEQLAKAVNHWHIKPAGTEGYRKAEVTLGGVDTNEISSKTFEAKAVSGLYFIGEVIDVTGHLGGHNFQWAWASGYAAGHAL